MNQEWADEDEWLADHGSQEVARRDKGIEEWRAFASEADLAKLEQRIEQGWWILAASYTGSITLVGPGGEKATFHPGWSPDPDEHEQRP